MTRSTLSKDDWLKAGFRALALEGPSALRAEALARALGATKGSFYWHFTDLPGFKAAMLERWRSKVATEIMADVAEAATPAARLQALLERAAAPAPQAYGGRAIEPAFRAWALSDGDVSAALAALDRERIAFIEGLLAEVGVADRTLAEVIYATYIGLDDLASKERADIGAGLARLLALIAP